MEHYPCKNVYLTALEIRNNLRAMIQNNHNAVESSVLKGAIDIIALLEAEILELRTKTGWHPGSELPPVDKETGLSDEVIAIQDMFCDGERVIYSRIVGSGWKHDNIKWWIEQPKE